MPTPFRVHAFVLTCDRPDTLRRCIATALNSLASGDALTIIDDSDARFHHANRSALRDLSRGYGVATRHVPAAQFSAQLRDARFDVGSWLDRTAARDIAPLRNLSLLLSVVFPAATTVFIDDDVCDFDLNVLHRAVGTASRRGGTTIIGADISGANENDSISRLETALDFLDRRTSLDDQLTAQQLFFVSTSSPEATSTAPKYVSGGYIGFRAKPTDLFAFPPGYNEDWLWCLLHQAFPDSTISRSGQVVVHDPPFHRKSTREDLAFELLGELVFECLLEYKPGSVTTPERILQDLAMITPGQHLMPATRAREVSQRATRLDASSCGLHLLREHGLAVLESMLVAGELEVAGSPVLSAWSRDAIAKQRAFAATLCDSALMTHIQTNVLEGTS